MLGEIFQKSTGKLTTFNDIPDECKRQYRILSQDLIDEHNKWFSNTNVNEPPAEFMEWYNAWMDSKYGFYFMYVTEITTQTRLLSQRLGLYQLPEKLQEWKATLAITTRKMDLTI